MSSLTVYSFCDRNYGVKEKNQRGACASCGASGDGASFCGCEARRKRIRAHRWTRAALFSSPRGELSSRSLEARLHPLSAGASGCWHTAGWKLGDPWLKGASPLGLPYSHSSWESDTSPALVCKWGIRGLLDHLILAAFFIFF